MSASGAIEKRQSVHAVLDGLEVGREVRVTIAPDVGEVGARVDVVRSAFESVVAKLLGVVDGLDVDVYNLDIVPVAGGEPSAAEHWIAFEAKPHGSVDVDRVIHGLWTASSASGRTESPGTLLNRFGGRCQLAGTPSRLHSVQVLVPRRDTPPGADLMHGPVDYLRQAFTNRYTPFVKRIAERAPADLLRRALSSEDPASGLATAIGEAVDLPPAKDPLARARARGVAGKQRLIDRAGGVLRVSEVADRLGISATAVQARRARGSILAVQQPNGEWVYPRCQFTDEGPLVEGLSEFLKAFHGATPWTQLSVLLAPSRRHGGRSALELLKTGEVAEACAIAARYGEQVA